MRETNYSAKEQSEIQKERALSDLELGKSGANFEDGRLEVTAEQIELAKKEMEAEKRAENPEVKSLEDLRQKAIEAGASPEEIEALDAKLEIARMGGEEYIAKLEDDLEKQAKDRKDRDKKVAAVLIATSLGIDIGGWALGVDFKGIIGASALAGLSYGGLAMLGSPIARIQNWLERRKYEKEGKALET